MPTGTSQPNPGRGKGNNNLTLSFEQYIGLAQAAMDQGDRVLAETYYQRAEHALRLMNEVKETKATSAADAHRNPEATAIRTNDSELSLEQEPTKV